MPDHGEDFLIGNHVPGVRHAHVRLGLIIERHHLHLEAQLLDRPLQLLDSELGTELDALAHGRLIARERTLRGDLHRPLRLPCFG